MTTIFCYGTLKKNQCRGNTLSRQKFIGEAETEPKYSMYDNGSYPMLTENGDTAIKGELYEVNDETMQLLDAIEGVSYGLYKRAEIAIKGVAEKVIGYVYLRDVDKYRKCGSVWPPKE